MFVKCLVIFSFIVSMLIIINQTLDYLILTWRDSSIFHFALLITALLLMIVLISVAIRSLFMTIRSWREKLVKVNDVDQILD